LQDHQRVCLCKQYDQRDLPLCPLAVLIEGLSVQWTGQFIFALAWLVIMLSIGSYGLMLKLLEHRTAARVASLMYLTPPTTLVAQLPPIWGQHYVD
jgi:drug/metabolite transporter (DMT)-like permease